ncbi:eukaryotic translation initiation factor 4E [Linderina pennispora]|uniref:Eukaryotic translation initiation factor 4E n=1 Tax=Linderina pennispora TaxID=61395 RepID=A0A1Y1WK55_9FUNG|nr:eukaryotic translation initiation factor 4E [Linderina pennispora]ORX73708.1 eukaryotic translation initiation factor 4E [Linderina pennispora]
MTEVQNTAAAKTVLTDAENFDTVHPLNSEWTLWFDNPSRRTNTSSWTQNLKEIVTLGTVEDFWGVHSNVTKAVDLPNGSNYHLFRKGIKPMWEDAANANGGRWGIQLQRSVGGKANDLWLNTLLACIGETFDASTDVCGAVFSNRKQCFRIAIWTRNAADKEACEAIGRHLKTVLNGEHQLEYMPHTDNAKSGPKVLYSV